MALLDVQEAELRESARLTGGWSAAVDLRDRGATVASVEQAAAALGGLDGLVNCAGIALTRPVTDITDDAWDDVLAVNLTAVFVVCRAALSHLLRAPGTSTIVNVASGQALRPSAGASAYASSKAGVVALSKVLAAELAPKVRVNAVCPGIVQTPMTQFLLEGHEDPDTAPFVAQYAMGRVAQPLEMARVILFLTGEDASYVTGTALAADGGRTFH